MTVPDLESLRCFAAVARHLNFRKAAAEVGLSPSAFSERIARLEDTLGVQLLARSTRRVLLTAAGRRLVPEVDGVLFQLHRCLTIVRADAPAPRFTLQIGTRYELGLSWLVPALSGLRARRPERSIDLYFADSPDLLRRVEEGAIDAMISSSRLTRAGLAHARLHEERYILVGEAAQVGRMPLLTVADAAHHRLLDLHPDLPLLRYFLDARPASEAWMFAEHEHLGTIGAVRARVLEGAGVAVLPRYFVEPDLQAGRVAALLPHTELRSDLFRLIWRSGHPLGEELRALAVELAALPLR